MKSRDPLLKPKPSCEPRWDTNVNEAKHTNQIIQDVCDANASLLVGTDGDNNNLLKDTENDSGDYSHLTDTNCNKKILYQFEGAAGPAKTFSKFL